MKPESPRAFWAVRRLFAAIALAVSAVSAAAAPATEQAIDLPTPSGNIAGSLRLPATGAPPLVVLIIAGSGPTDRNGNSAGLPGQNNSLMMLAQALGEAGIATVRYDKRGIAASRLAGPAEADLRFENYVDDAAAWIAMLSRDPRFASVAVLGHSEGALIGMLAAQKGKASAFVSVAGVARGAADILREQLAAKLPAALALESERILGALEHGETGVAAPPALASLYRPSVQPYLASWFRYRPSAQIGKLRMPVLIAHGSTDLQVALAEARALKAARPDAQLVVIEGMNHVLKMVSGDMGQQMASYSDPALPLAPALSGALVDFLRAL